MLTPLGAIMVRSPLVFNQTDGDLERRVVNFLSQQHFPGRRGVEVEARQGIVTLRGRVRSFHERQLCVNCCQRVAGVVGVSDKIQVALAHEPEPIRAFRGFMASPAALMATG